MSGLLIPVIFIVGLALIFDFLNGFHDAANAISTVVVTGTLKPYQAVIVAGLAEFVGFFAFGVEIAKTVGKGVVQVDHVTLTVILAALIGAITWNILTWILGLPTSSSHALIGGLIGAGVASAGIGVVIPQGFFKIVTFIAVAPILGLVGATLFTTLILWIFRKSNFRKTQPLFKYFQLASAAVYCVGHGTNDAQKTMGVIALTLFVGGVTKDFHLQNWIVFACYSAIALGTMSGGWRIVKTMGTKITKIRAREGFCAESAASMILLGTAHFGIPVSTTHVIAGSIMGVGSAQSAAKVRWVTARKIVWAWILTIPLTSIWSASMFMLINFCSKHFFPH
jgi:PiT family inorganic phosphate transporter